MTLATHGLGRRLAGACLCVLACCELQAQSLAPPAVSAELDTVTVTGRRREKVFEERISTFVSSVAVRSR